jgi:hypothetical protein
MDPFGFKVNPAYAKYYRQVEARQLLQQAGFEDIVLYHRHGYCSTVMSRRPADER